jgi:hypothetical protein
MFWWKYAQDLFSFFYQNWVLDQRISIMKNIELIFKLPSGQATGLRTYSTLRSSPLTTSTYLLTAYYTTVLVPSTTYYFTIIYCIWTTDVPGTRKTLHGMYCLYVQCSSCWFKKRGAEGGRSLTGDWRAMLSVCISSWTHLIVVIIIVVFKPLSLSSLPSCLLFSLSLPLLPTHSPTHPLTQPPTHSLTHSLTHAPTHPHNFWLFWIAQGCAAQQGHPCVRIKKLWRVQATRKKTGS